MRLRLLVLGVLIVAGVAGWALAADDGEKTRGDYCGPPELVQPAADVSDSATVVPVEYEHVASVDLALGLADRGTGSLVVIGKDGKAWLVAATDGATELLLDLSDEVATGVEQGLLGVAVSPDGAFLYLYATLIDRTAHILEYAFDADGIDASTRRDVYVIDDPDPTHNGGRLAFDDDGMLLLGLGDGGNGDETGAAQDLSVPFGKLLRIDPRPSGDAAFGIPDDNPFLGQDGALGEIWAFGFRNPWGWSIDRDTGDLWVGDVGQLCFEEIDTAAQGGAGDDFGWSHLEGGHEFRGPVLGPGGPPDPNGQIADLGPRPADLVPPVVEYDHADGACGVIGGFVYRGSAIPDLRGAYLWTDLCVPEIHVLRRDGERWTSDTLSGKPPGVVSFGEAADGELYLLSLSDGVFRIEP